jgi:sialidase-1
MRVISRLPERSMKIRLRMVVLFLFGLLFFLTACNGGDEGEDPADGGTDDDDDDDDNDNDNNNNDDNNDSDDDVSLVETDVFVNQKDGYPLFRIPAIIETAAGGLLAFSEGRQNILDTGDIDIVMKRSLDNGQTWSALQVVFDNGSDTAGNPTPVLDRETGDILLPFCTNPADDQYNRRVFITRSADDGENWSAPVEITDSVKLPEWTWYATGPGRSIQLASGRFVVPCDHRNAATGEARSHVIYSDDGETWQIGGILGPDTDESQVAQLADGSLLINMRDLSSAKQRWIARSYDEGETWTESIHDTALPDPSCMGSLLQTSAGLLFSNPASDSELLRQKMTVRLSLDGGETWAHSKVLRAGGAAYSALAATPDGKLGLLYENGPLPFLPYARITFAVFTLGWLEQ